MKSLSHLTVYFFLLWGSISAQEVSIVPQDPTAAGRWSLLTGTDFLHAGEQPYIDREGNMWRGYQEEVFVLKQNQLSKITVGWHVNAIVQDSTGAMWFFGHRPRFAHCLALRRYDTGDNENAIEFDCESPGGCRWQRAILDACQTPIWTQFELRHLGVFRWELDSPHN